MCYPQHVERNPFEPLPNIIIDEDQNDEEVTDRWSVIWSPMVTNNDPRSIWAPPRHFEFRVIWPVPSIPRVTMTVFDQYIIHILSEWMRQSRVSSSANSTTQSLVLRRPRD